MLDPSRGRQVHVVYTCPELARSIGVSVGMVRRRVLQGKIASYEALIEGHVWPVIGHQAIERYLQRPDADLPLGDIAESGLNHIRPAR